jgi:FkbH-like protein
MTSTVKCLVWDLDDTLWDGVVLEGDDPQVIADAASTLTTLDQRGILHAVASRGEHDVAVRHLTRRGVGELFSAVEINWGAKSESIRRLAKTLNIGLDTIAFVDNDPLERAEVAGALPMVRTYPADDVDKLPGLVEFTPQFVTAESRQRRRMYQVESARRTAEDEHSGPSAEFLNSLGLAMTIRRATEDDLARAHELTVRTNQLNTTGWTADMDELRRLSASPDHEVLVASLSDRFGPYGTIGLALTEITATASVLKLLLMSCRVMSRGVGSVLLNHVVARAMAEGLAPMAEFVPSEANRIMLVTLRFAGFELVGESGAGLWLRFSGAEPPAQPRHVKILS